MRQALWKLLGTPGDERQVVLLYGNKSSEDILLKVRPYYPPAHCLLRSAYCLLSAASCQLPPASCLVPT